jgi:hypothetical protein
LVEIFTLWVSTMAAVGSGARPSLASGQAGQFKVEPGEDAFITPERVVVRGAVGWEGVGYVSPGDPRAVEIEQGIDDFAQVDAGRLPRGPAVDAGLPPGGEDRLDQGPAGVGDVRGI